MAQSVSRRMALRGLAGAAGAVIFSPRARSGATSADHRRSIVSVSRSEADLVVPPDGEGFRYGTGYMFQAGPTQAGLMCNLRTEGFPVGDFEAGMDAVIFDDAAKINQPKPVPVTRTTKYADRITGRWRIVLKHGVKGGFVPFGAKRPDGSPHPFAGTGVTFCEALDFPMKGNGYYDKREKTRGMVRTTEVQHLAFDGKRFSVTGIETFTEAKPLRVAGTPWKIYCPSLRMGIPDGDDLLMAVAATTGSTRVWFAKPHTVGVSRWRCHQGRWRPVEFHPVDGDRKTSKRQVVYGVEVRLVPIEPTLIRDIDGSLLFSARFAYEAYDEHALRVWRSRDGADWKRIIESPETKGQAPVSINQAADGTPYLVSNPLGRERDRLVLWPLNDQRTGLLAPVLARDALEQFGPAPSGKAWFMDHPNAAVVRLADGHWHNLLVYRIMDRGEHSGRAPAKQTGLYVETVRSTGPEHPQWNF
ncbi:MAG: hypothetical protein QF363_01205 [Planctomycetaceae bacterium]|nr:hypothetical protein [Planctomycetaceae bacterium]